jgi:hypothetical protein
MGINRTVIPGFCSFVCSKTTVERAHDLQMCCLWLCIFIVLTSAADCCQNANYTAWSEIILLTFPLIRVLLFRKQWKLYVVMGCVFLVVGDLRCVCKVERKATVGIVIRVCLPSVRPSAQNNLLPVDGFLLNFKFGRFTKICREN